MLRNPIYTGTYHCNRREWGKSEVGRRTPKTRRPEEVLGTTGNAPHLAIVDAATWLRVLARTNANADKTPNERLKSGGNAVYTLSGLLHCRCGAHFVMDLANARNKSIMLPTPDEFAASNIAHVGWCAL